MNILDFLKENILVFDGGMGTLLQKEGLLPGELPERWNLSHPDIIRRVHLSYYEAGAHVVTSNTFGANTLKLARTELDEIVREALSHAKWAKDFCTLPGERFIAYDMGPTGKLLKPYGDFDFEEAVAVYRESAILAEKYGADVILIETMNDSYETKAALLAVKENTTLPVFVTNAYDAQGKLMTGATPSAMTALLEGLGADALGANCSLGPTQLRPVAEELLRTSSVPVMMQPNAGLPRSEGANTVYDVTPAQYAEEVLRQVKSGVRIVGGCCGTTPEYIAALKEKLRGVTPVPLTEKNITCVSSYTHSVAFGSSPILIGERINPTGKKSLKQALLENDIGYILEQGIAQEEKGVHILDVNVGLPEIDEADMLARCVKELQSITDLPLQIDSADAAAMERALRLYNGKAMVNSVSGKAESMRTVFPLVKKYGGLVVALTLDESGIPDTVEGRVEIARRIVKTAAEYGISKTDIIFDTLAMTVSADPRAALVTLASLRQIREELGCHTSLGVSNVSFGLPARDTVNAAFFTSALENGLSAAIMNPNSTEMMKAYHAYNVLHGLDEKCASYIAFAADLPMDVAPAPEVKKTAEATEGETSLKRAICKGLTEQARAITEQLLASAEPLAIVNSEIIPALDSVGKGFEEKTVYLPQLLMSAEAAKAAFACIKAKIPASEKKDSTRTVILATVKGDIHDIGKNIVKLLLENYGFFVIDLGRDVAPEAIVDAVILQRAPLVGLSALMTTTVPAMEETVRLLREKAPFCKTIVGGAVLTKEYAARIGADAYGADAMEAVRYAQSLFEA